LPAREINLKACAPEIRTRNHTGRPGELNPGSSDRPSRSVRTVSQSPEPLRQATSDVIVNLNFVFFFSYIEVLYRTVVFFCA